MMISLCIILAALVILAVWQARTMIKAGREQDGHGDGGLTARKAETGERLDELDRMIGSAAPSADEGDGGRTRWLLGFFSIPLLWQFPCAVRIEEVNDLPEGLVSAVGNPDLARVLGVPCNRIRIKLRPGDTAYVAQLVGGRLPEYVSELPDGFRFRYYRITVEK